MKTRLNDLLPGESLPFSFTLINLHDFDHNKLLESESPEAVILAILGDYRNKAPKEVVSQILRRLAEQSSRAKRYNSGGISYNWGFCQDYVN